jgi:hypothetical protein
MDMWWFGESWGAPCCEEELHVATPVGVVCMECEKRIVGGDQGFLVPHRSAMADLGYHRVCFLRTIIPCGMWTDEMLVDMPARWVEHRRERHQELGGRG